MRVVTWWRQEYRSTIPVATYCDLDAHKPIIVIDEEMLGLVKVTEPPAYDNGVFYVIDTIKDLKWAVLKDGHVYRTINLDKYEAIRVADEMKEAQ